MFLTAIILKTSAVFKDDKKGEFAFCRDFNRLFGAFALHDGTAEKVMWIHQAKGFAAFKKTPGFDSDFFRRVPVINYQVRAIFVVSIRQKNSFCSRRARLAFFYN